MLVLTVLSASAVSCSCYQYASRAKSIKNMVGKGGGLTGTDQKLVQCAVCGGRAVQWLVQWLVQWHGCAVHSVVHSCYH